MLSKRQSSLLNIIINNPLGISGKQLSASLGVSDRTIRSDINQMNQEYKAYSCAISSSKREGYFITPEHLIRIKQIKAKFDQDIEVNSTERLFAILGKIIFSKEPLDLIDLAEQLFISEQTIYKDLVRLQKMLLITYSIDIFSSRGNELLLIATEEQIRSLFFKISKVEILKNSQQEPFCLKLLSDGKFNESAFSNLKDAINNYYLTHEIIFTAESFYMIVWALYFTIIRNEHGYPIKTLTNRTIESDVIIEVVEHLHQQHYEIYKSDQILLQSYMKTLGMIKSNQNIMIISDVCKQITSEFAIEILRKYGFDISNHSELYDNLLLHLDVMINRIHDQLQFVNPIINEVKQKYPYAYEIAILIAPIIYKYQNAYLQDDEISYIAIYIQSFIESMDVKIKGLIVSRSGMGLSKLISQWMLKNFSDCIEIVDIIPSYQLDHYLQENEVDLIISTLPLTIRCNTMIAYVNSIPDVNDLQLIQYCTKQLHIEKRIRDVIEDLFNEQLYKRFEVPVSFHKVIRDLSLLLYKENKIGNYEVFTSDVIQRESVYPTSVNEKLMIPHPLVEMALKNSVAVGILENGLIDQSNQKIIFLLALNGEKTQDLDILFNLINALGMDDTQINKLMNCNIHNFKNSLVEIAEG